MQKHSESPDAELCGLILENGDLMEVENTHPTPERGFMISGKLISDLGDKVVGTWHTHPKTTAQLSQDDYLGFSCWPDLTHYIAGTDGVAAYRVGELGLIEELSLADD